MKQLDSNYKFRELNVYADTAWLAHGKKKYRTVFENDETTYLYAEFSCYNKLFDEFDWECKIVIKCFKKEGSNNKEVCTLKVDKKVPKTDNIFFVREGWGNETKGKFWTKGTYYWEAYIDEKLVGTKEFYVEGSGLVSDEDNPYFDIKSVQLYEGPGKNVTQKDRKYYSSFSSKDTRYIWVEFCISNKLTENWQGEFIFNFYNDAGQLYGTSTRIRKVSGNQYIITTGWGSEQTGSWAIDKYRLEVVFQDQLVAVIPFDSGTEHIEGTPPVLKGSSLYSGGTQEVGLASEESLEEVMNSLEELIGLQNVKKSINDYISFLKFLEVRKNEGYEDNQKINLHAVFRGNPGTGKTTVAKMLGKIYNKMGLLSKGKVLEVGRAELIGEYIGQTAPKVKEAINNARGGILFIDEAYSLVRNPNDTKDFGREAIEVIIKEMSDGKGDIAIIMAGYPYEMETMLRANPGMKSRIGQYYDFLDYLPQELIAIAELLAEKKKVNFTEEANEYLVKKITDAYRNRDQTFGNARLVTSIVSEAKMNMGLRLMRTFEDVKDIKGDLLNTIEVEDVELIFASQERGTPMIGVDEALLHDATTELNHMIGLTEVKNEIHELIQLVKFYRETGKDVLGKFSLHTIFKGNPGTGKTTVARIIAKIYKALGILERGHIVECDRQSLVASYVGQTANKTKEQIEKAKGGVLFIDEAYALTSKSGSDFGKEAVEVILKQMEDRRGEFIVIAAGYPDNMDEFLEMNPGLKSRFDRVLNFEDFDVEELYDIAVQMFDTEDLTPDELASEHLKKYLETLYEKRDKFFGNARSVRKVVKQAVKNQHLRMSTIPKSKRTRKMLRTLLLEDMKEFTIDSLDRNKNKGVGFNFGAGEV